MDPFELPEVLPTDAAELAALRAAAEAVLASVRAKVDSGEDVSEDELNALRSAVAGIATIDAAIEEADKVTQARQDEINALLEAGTGADPADETDETETDETDEVDADAVVGEAEQITEEAASVTASAGKAPARKTKFAGLGRKAPAVPGKNSSEIGWRMDSNSFGYKPGLVGFKEMAEAVESVRPGSRARRNSQPTRGGFSAQTIGRLHRDVELIEDSHALVAAINAATREEALPGGSLVAAGGWCAPSEQLYDFCDVPVAQDLLSLPEITIRRGGVRWPVEPDLSEIFENFQFFFTEPELEATDPVTGLPTAVKECVEIPCPDEFEEIRLNAVGYCVEAGILQAQGWPELIEWFMQSLTQEHFRAISRRSINDMVAGSGAAKVIPAGAQIAAGSSILNSLALMAMNLRLKKGLARTATVEGVAPSWLFEVVRADMANQNGVDTKAVTDAQVTGWLSARNIALQFVADWQSRDAGKPGNLDTLVYPSTVDVLLYPAGTWFRSMSNVIELGVMYPKEQLQLNRFTKFFTEDAIAIGKRCNDSINVRIPICPSGAIGARQTITCNTVTP